MPATDPDDVVYAIEDTHAYLDRDNRRVYENAIDVEQGWFATRAAAQTRVDQLNKSLEAAWKVDEDRVKRKRDKEIAEAKQTNAEVKILRDAGMRKAFVKVPPRYPGRTFADWINHKENYTSHAVVALTRSQFDTSTSAQEDS